MILIPIGIDCGVAIALNQLKKRDTAYPFDWNVTYRGVSDILKNDFRDFVPTKRYGIQTDPRYSSVFNKYDVLFIHDDWFKKEKIEQEKYHRRIDRLKKLLKEPSNDTFYFIRKGHMFHHHREYYFQDDVESVCKLSKCLKELYPHMKFKIFLIICCPVCYRTGIPSINNDESIIVINNLQKIDIRNTQDNLYNCISQDIFPQIEKIEKMNSK